jgi:hypothetical protein
MVASSTTSADPAVLLLRLAKGGQWRPLQLHRHLSVFDRPSRFVRQTYEGAPTRCMALRVLRSQHVALARVERGLRCLPQSLSTGRPELGDQQGVDQVLRSAAFSSGSRLRLGIHILGELLSQWKARDHNRLNAGRVQECRNGWGLLWLDQRIAPADINVKHLVTPLVLHRSVCLSVPRWLSISVVPPSIPFRVHIRYRVRAIQHLDCPGHYDSPPSLLHHLCTQPVASLLSRPRLYEL